jgi:transposase
MVRPVTRLAIMRAIVAGERDAQKLVQLRDRRCRKSEEEISRELSGHWRADHLFSLRQALKMYDAILEQMADYEQEILRKLAEMETEECRGQQAPQLRNPEKAKAIKKRGQDVVRQALYRMSGPLLK